MEWGRPTLTVNTSKQVEKLCDSAHTVIQPGCGIGSFGWHGSGPIKKHSPLPPGQAGSVGQLHSTGCLMFTFGMQPGLRASHSGPFGTTICLPLQFGFRSGLHVFSGLHGYPGM